MLTVFVIVTLTHAGRPDETVTIRPAVPLVQCLTQRELIAQEWLAVTPLYAGWTIKPQPDGVRCSGTPEGSA